MTDARWAHPGCPGHAALASRSPGVRAAPRLSSAAVSGKPINFKHRLIIGGKGEVIANQLDPSVRLECTFFLFMSNKKPLPFLLPSLSAQFAPNLVLWLHLSRTCGGGSEQDNTIVGFIACECECAAALSAS